jgi:serine/threonine-protein phosphatase 6 catalytic subunit
MPQASTQDIDRWLAKIRKCQHLTESELKSLCDIVREILMEESNVQPVAAPVTVCGDVHGQFYDVLELFRVGGDVPQTRYIFIGRLLIPCLPHNCLVSAMS